MDSAIPSEYKQFLARVLQFGRNTGRIEYRHLSIRSCPICGKTAGYAKYTRNTRLHRKGDINTKRPLYFSGIDLGHSYVQNYVSIGGCSTCIKKIKPHLLKLLEKEKTKEDEGRIIMIYLNRNQEMVFKTVSISHSVTPPSFKIMPKLVVKIHFLVNR